MKQVYVLASTVAEARMLARAIVDGARPTSRAEYEAMQAIIVAVDNQRNASVSGDETTAVEATARAVAQQFQRDRRVVAVCIAALEAANFHDEAASLKRRLAMVTEPVAPRADRQAGSGRHSR